MIVSFSDHLAHLMAERGLKAVDLARGTGLTHVAIGNYLKGRIPRWQEAEKLASFFGVQPDYLLNPARYAEPMQKARAAAEAFKGSAKEKQLEFDRVVRLEMSKLSERQAGFEAMESLMDKVDWRKRALAAESKLADLKKTLAGLAEKL